MNPWLFLILCVLAGGVLLAQPRGLAFRGSTLLGFLLLTCGLSSPLALHPTRMMLASGAGSDAFIGVWNLWWTRIAAAQGLNPLATNWLFHPDGTSLVLHTYNLTYGVLSLPLQWLGGLIFHPESDPAAPAKVLFLVYNLILLGSFTLTGYFLYRLALSVTGHRTGAILGGIVLAYANYRFANTVRLHVLAMEFLVLALWAWIVLLRRPSPRALLLFAGSYCLLLYASLEYAAYAILLFLVPALGRGFRRVLHDERAAEDTPPPIDVDLRKRRWFGAGVLTLLLGGLLILPFVTGLLVRLSQGGTQFDPQLGAFFSADLLDFVLPNPRHPLFGGPFQNLTARFHNGDGGFGMSLGWLTLVLAVVATIAAFRSSEGRRWFWGFLCFWLLSLGPMLHVGGTVHANLPLPQALLSKLLPFLGGSRTPIRYLAPAWICLSLLIAIGWAARGRRGAAGGFLHGPLVRAVPATRIELVIGSLVLFESLAAPLPVIPVETPEVYGRLLASPGYYAVATLPTPPAREAMLYQTIHQQRLVQNVATAMPLHTPHDHSPFATPHWEALTNNLATPGWIAQMPATEQTQLVGALRRFLGEYRIRFVALHRTRPTLAEDGRSYREAPVCDETQFAAFRENLRKLHPMHEREIGGAVLFEFEATEIRE